LINLKYLFFICCLLFVSIPSIAQNIFDYSNSLRYTESLKKDKQYELALAEILRIEPPQQADTSYVILLMSILNHTEYTDKASYLQKYKSYAENEEVYNLIICNSLLIDSTAIAEYCLNTFDTNRQFYHQYKFYTLVSKREYNAAMLYLNTASFELTGLKLLKELSVKKNKAVGITLSAIVPGLGKVYYKQFVDGLTAFVSTASYAYLSYSTLRKNGVNNVFPWLNTGLFGLFYFGNIVGTASAHDRYYSARDLQLKKIIHFELEKIYATY
jgi:hypothetical protein